MKSLLPLALLAFVATPAFAAGEEYFPLNVGDTTVFRDPSGSGRGTALGMEWVVGTTPTPGVYHYNMVFGSTQWLAFDSAQSALITHVPLPGGGTRPEVALRFDQPVGASWSVSLGPAPSPPSYTVTYRGPTPLRVPAGSFYDTLRFDIASVGGAVWIQLYVAKNVGPIARVYPGPTGHVEVLERASINGIAYPAANYGFHPPTRLQVGVGHASSAVLAKGDFDADGAEDLMVGNNDRTVSVLLGDGAGGFLYPTTLQARGRVEALSVGDVTGDGKPDVVVADPPFHGSDGGRLYRNVTAPGGLLTFAPPVRVPLTGYPREIQLGDVDGDGDLDLVALASYEVVEVLLNDGQGAFAFASNLRFATGTDVRGVSLALADVDLDGNADVVATTQEDGPPIAALAGISAPLYGAAHVFLADGSGGFGAPVRTWTGLWPSRVLLADVDGDGAPDLLTANKGHGPYAGVSVFLGDGAGAFRYASYAREADGTLASMGLGDVTGDGRPDLVTSGDDRKIRVLENVGRGRFAVGARTYGGQQPWGVLLMDLNADGKDDVLTVQAGTNELVVRLSR